MVGRLPGEVVEVVQRGSGAPGRRVPSAECRDHLGVHRGRVVRCEHHRHQSVVQRCPGLVAQVEGASVGTGVGADVQQPGATGCGGPSVLHPGLAVGSVGLDRVRLLGELGRGPVGSSPTSACSAASVATTTEADVPSDAPGGTADVTVSSMPSVAGRSAPASTAPMACSSSGCRVGVGSAQPVSGDGPSW